MSTTNALEAARRGYAFLAGPGKQWDFEVSRLDPDTLDLSSGMDCALCQAGNVNNYWAAIERLAIEGLPVTDEDSAVALPLDASGEVSVLYLWERRHGFRTFDSYTDPTGEAIGERYDTLTQAWRQVIKEHRDGH
jgi:hypothetical protein